MTRFNPNRRGMASLELVLVAPFILALTTGLFLAGRSAIAKAATVTQARHDAYRQREATAPGTPFSLPATAAIAGEADSKVEKPVASGYMLRGTKFAAKTESKVIGQPWDSRAIKYQTDGKSVAIHTTELGQILPNLKGAQKIATKTIEGLAFSLNPSDDPVRKGIAKAGQAENIILKPIGIAMKLAAEAMKGPQYRLIELARDAADFFDLDAVVEAIDLVLVVYDPLVDACQNLYSASIGEEGRWGTDLNKLKKLGDVIK